MRRHVASALVAGSLAFGSIAYGQSADNKAAAEALYEEGKTLMNKGKFLAAAEKFQASNRLDSGIGTIMYMADAFEKAGKVASAWANWREAEALANQAKQTARAETAKQRADALEPRLTKVLIQVDKNALLDGFRLKRGKTKVTKDLFGVATPVDAGRYEVVAQAPGYLPWKGSVAVKKEGTTITLRVPLLKVDPDAAKAKASKANATPDTGSPSNLAYKATAISLGGLGAIGVGLGTFFAVQAKSEFDEANTRCSESSCSDPLASEQTSRALTKSHLATVSFASGGAALGAGLLVWLLAPSGKEKADKATAQLQIVPSISPDYSGISVGGSW